MDNRDLTDLSKLAIERASGFSEITNIEISEDVI